MWSDIDPAEERIDPQNESGLLTSAASILRGSILLPLDWFQLFTAVWQKTVQQSDWIFSESQIVKGLKFEEKMYFFAVLVLLGTELRTVSSGKSHFSYTSVSQSQRGEPVTSLLFRFLVFISLPLRKVWWFACVVWLWNEKWVLLHPLQKNKINKNSVTSKSTALEVWYNYVSMSREM